MKISKIDYRICCDVPFCGKLADYKIAVGDENACQHVCRGCAKNLKNQLAKLGEI